MRMGILRISLLGALLGTAGCNACAQERAPDAAPDEASPTRGKSKTTTSPEEAATVPPKDTITAVIFQADNKTRVWMESRSGLVIVDPTKSFWVNTGFVTPSGSGYRYYLSNNTSYLTMTAPSEGATVLTEILARQTEPPPGYKLRIQANNAGRQRVNVKPPVGQPSRLGMFSAAPSPLVWMEAQKPEVSGPVLPAPQKSTFQAREGGGFENAIPTGATAVAGVPLEEEALAPWKADLEAFRGPNQQIFLAEQVNLDADPELEVFLCIPAGRSNGCFVGDLVGEERRYHPVAIDYAGGEVRPLFYQSGNGTYVMYTESSANRVLVVRANGGHYATDTIQ